MDLFGVKPSGYRHPVDPTTWSRQTWGLAAVVVLGVLLFAYGIG
jgi:hypothetical protein